MNKNGWQDAPTVRAGFMVPPVKGPSAKMPAATESPIASGAAFCKERRFQGPLCHILAASGPLSNENGTHKPNYGLDLSHFQCASR